MASKTEEIEREKEVAAQARPFILGKLRERTEPLEISKLVAERWGVDERLSYRWTQYISDDYQRQRRRYVTIGLVVLWLGALLAAAGASLSIFGVDVLSLAAWIPGLAVGLPLVVLGAVLIRRAGSFVTLSV